MRSWGSRVAARAASWTPRRFSATVPPATDSPFAAIYDVSTELEFLEGSRQAYAALGALMVRVTSDATALPCGLCTPRFRRAVEAAHEAKFNLCRIAGKAEHIDTCRISWITVEPRAAPLKLDSITPPLWSTCRPSSSVGQSREHNDELSELAQNNHVRCAVDMVVASPPERWANGRRFYFYLSGMHSSTDPREQKNLAYMMTHTGFVHGLWVAFDNLFFRLRGRRLLVSPDELRAKNKWLASNWPYEAAIKPHTVKKTIVFELTPDLRWEIDQVTTDATPRFGISEP